MDESDTNLLKLASRVSLNKSPTKIIPDNDEEYEQSEQQEPSEISIKDDEEEKPLSEIIIPIIIPEIVEIKPQTPPRPVSVPIENDDILNLTNEKI